MAAEHEIHLTFRDMHKPFFQRACDDAGANAKAIIMYDCEMKKMYTDMIATATIYGNEKEAHTRLKGMKIDFAKLGLVPVREKIEVAAKNSHDKLLGTNFHHYEAHVSAERGDSLNLLISHPQVYVSAVLHLDDEDWEDDNGEEIEPEVLTLTIRSYSQKLEKFHKNYAGLSGLLEGCYGGGSRGVEFSLYDTAPEHDDMWIAASRPILV